MNSTKLKTEHNNKEELKALMKSNKIHQYLLSSERFPESTTNSKGDEMSLPNALSDFQSLGPSQPPPEILKILEQKDNSEHVITPQLSMESQRDTDPLLFIDVNLGGTQKQIIVYKGDNPHVLT